MSERQEYAFTTPTTTGPSGVGSAGDDTTCPTCGRPEARQRWAGFGRRNVRYWCRFCHTPWPEEQA